MAPGFDFADSEIGDRETLISLYPSHQDLIKRLTT
jgi:predicted cupin superfamily sugar epimerase